MLARFARSLSLLLLSSGFCLAIALPSRAAERVTLSYEGIEGSVAVADLARLAETGEPSPDLALYLALANRQPEDLREILTRGVPMDGNLLAGALNSFAGNFLLDRVDNVVTAPGRDSRDDLRAALIASAASNNRLTLLEVLQNHPADDVQIDGDRLVQFVNQIQSLRQQLSNFGF